MFMKLVCLQSIGSKPRYVAETLLDGQVSLRHAAGCPGKNVCNSLMGSLGRGRRGNLSEIFRKVSADFPQNFRKLC